MTSKSRLAELEILTSNPYCDIATLLEYADVLQREADSIGAAREQLITKRAKSVIHKTYSTKSNASDSPLDFVLSDATPDRYGDTIDPNGWDLKNFSRNPIALFNHRSDFPIGRWQNLSVKDNALRGHLHMAPSGTSDRIDELRALIDAGVLRSVSVGFMSIESTSRKDANGNYIGVHYLKQELVETSLVTVPANPNAVLTAKNLGVTEATLSMVFGKAAVSTGDTALDMIADELGRATGQMRSEMRRELARLGAIIESRISNVKK